MAMRVQSHLVGVDVSKAELHICEGENQRVHALENQRRPIRSWLKALPTPTCLAVEATNTFHLTLLEEAHRLGHTVYVVDGYRLKHYRESTGGRAKTDASDARLIHRYLERERKDLRPWTPPPQGYVTVQRLLHRRAVLVQSKTAIEQSLKELPELKRSLKALLRKLTHLDTLIQKRLLKALEDHGWLIEKNRCQAIEGVGPLTSAALVMAFNRGHFQHSDAFVAFLGLDVRVRDSGQCRGKRKLTKKGDPELRRLLYLAAMHACKTPRWKDFYQRYLARGLSKIQALVALSRKLARIAFALMKNQTHYRAEGVQKACLAT
jgi:transposase